MLLFKHYFAYFHIIFSTAFLFSNVISLPLAKDNLYDKYIDFLVKSNCTMPEEVALPFSSASSQPPFSYLSDPLKECQTSNVVEEYDETRLLCSEIFEVLGNITCTKYNKPFPKIKIPLSEDICNDFKTMKDVFPKGEDYLSGKLVDGTLCKVLCSKHYEFLCNTLIWSYSVQAKIKSLLENSKQMIEEENTNENIPSKKGIPNINISLAGEEPGEDNSKEIADNKISDEKEKTDASKFSSIKTSSGSPSTLTSDKTAILINSTVTGTSVRATSILNVPVVPKNESKPDIGKDDTQLVQFNQSLPAKDDTQNEVNVHPGDNNAKEISTVSTKPDIKISSLTPQISNITDKEGKDIPLNNLPDKDKNTAVNNGKINVNSDEVVPQDNENDNSLNNVDIEGGKNEMKVKDTNGKDDDKKIEKPQLTDFETPLVSSDTDLKQSESTTLPMFPNKDEDTEHQEDKEQEQYNDTENEGDYPKSEYDNSFNPPEKNKEPSVKSSATDNSNQMSNSYDAFISSRSSIGRVPDDIPRIPSFPEQEDSHFFFYFLSVVFILMAGYLIFHNKQKIIALIVEGRHERRRRSHGAGYKKLDTK